MPDASKYQPGDMFFDKATGFVYVVSKFQCKASANYGYRTYRYGKPPKGKYIQHFRHEHLTRMIKTSSPDAARILFGEVKQWVNIK